MAPDLSDSVEQAVSLGEAFLDSEALELVPVVGYVIKGGKAIHAIRGRARQRRVVEFLKEFQKCVGDRDAKVAERIRTRLSDDEAMTILGEDLLVAAEGLDRAAKAPILARFAAGLLGGEIDFVMFERVRKSLDAYHDGMYDSLLQTYGPGANINLVREVHKAEMVSAGFLFYDNWHVGTIGGGAPSPVTTNVGATFARIGLLIDVDQSIEHDLDGRSRHQRDAAAKKAGQAAPEYDPKAT